MRRSAAEDDLRMRMQAATDRLEEDMNARSGKSGGGGVAGFERRVRLYRLAIAEVLTDDPEQVKLIAESLDLDDVRAFLEGETHLDEVDELLRSQRVDKARISDWTKDVQHAVSVDALGVIAVLGTSILTGFLILPLLLLVPLTTALGGIALGLSPRWFALSLDVVWLPLFAGLMGLSQLWLRFRYARPFLLLPGWILAFTTGIFVTLAPGGSQTRKYWISSLVDSWPGTAILAPASDEFDSADLEISWRDYMKRVTPPGW